MSYTIQKTSSQILVNVQDDLTIADVRGFRDELAAAALESLPVVVNAKNATRIDISFVQVLYAAQKTAGTMTFQDCSAGIREYLGRAGVRVDRWSPQPSPTDRSMKEQCNG